MTHRWLTRALVAVAVPALLVPAVASSATAAVKPPAVPTLAAVTKIYPHLEGGSADIMREKVYATGKKCEQGKLIKGAVSKSATYMPSFDVESIDDFALTGEEPGVVVTAARLPSVALARQYMRGGEADTKNCAAEGGLGGPHSTYKIKKLSFKLGAEHWGYQVTWASKKSTTVANALFVRRGQDVVSVVTMSLDGGAAPSLPQTVEVTRLALKTAAH